MVLISRAGFPATTPFSGTFFVTTDPAPTRAFFPIIIPGRIVEFAPILAPCLISGPLRFFFTSGDRGYFAFVRTTLGPIHESSSNTEYSGIKTWLWMRTLFPMFIWCSMTVNVPMLTLLPIVFNSRMFTLFPVCKCFPIRFPAYITE